LQHHGDFEVVEQDRVDGGMYLELKISHTGLESAASMSSLESGM
jgi:hypothetical protein